MYVENIFRRMYDIVIEIVICRYIWYVIHLDGARAIKNIVVNEKGNPDKLHVLFPRFWSHIHFFRCRISLWQSLNYNFICIPYCYRIANTPIWRSLEIPVFVLYWFFFLRSPHFSEGHSQSCIRVVISSPNFYFFRTPPPLKCFANQLHNYLSSQFVIFWITNLSPPLPPQQIHIFSIYKQEILSFFWSGFTNPQHYRYWCTTPSIFSLYLPH